MDLSEILSGASEPPPIEELLDTSGRPRPERVIVTLSSGIAFDATIKYGGTMNGERKYGVIAEVDWATAGVERIDVDRWPPDVFMTLKIPDAWTDEEATTFGHSITWGVIGQGDYLPRKLVRGPDLTGDAYRNNMSGGERLWPPG